MGVPDCDANPDTQPAAEFPAVHDRRRADGPRVEPRGEPDPPRPVGLHTADDQGTSP
jgi:hypothetical protein